MPGIASAATAVALAYVGAGTATIRIGAGGIMLPNHSPLQVAEQFGVSRGPIRDALRILDNEGLVESRKRGIFVIGLSAEETAEIVGASPGAVRVAQHRALGKLRKNIPPGLA